MNRLGNWISGKSQTPFYARREFNIKKQVQELLSYQTMMTIKFLILVLEHR